MRNPNKIFKDIEQEMESEFGSFIELDTDMSFNDDEKLLRDTHDCKYIKKIGSSCSLNNNCKYPNCDVD